MEDEPEQEALFYIEGPDEDECVWIHGASSAEPWARNLGPADKVAAVLSEWLRSLDRGDRLEAPAESQVAPEAMKRLGKKSRKAAKPGDHREEGGQG